MNPPTQRPDPMTDADELADWKQAARVEAGLRREFQEAESKLGAAYLRLRALIPGAFDTPHAPTGEQVWETTEKALVSALRRAPQTGMVSREAIAKLILKKFLGVDDFGQSLAGWDKGCLELADAILALLPPPDDRMRFALQEILKLADGAHASSWMKMPDAWQRVNDIRLTAKAALALSPPSTDQRGAVQEVAQWMIRHSYVTGHGDTLDDLLGELVHQVHANALLEVHKAVTADECAKS